MSEEKAKASTNDGSIIPSKAKGVNERGALAASGPAQRMMLEMALSDVQHGRFIEHNDVEIFDKVWLAGLGEDDIEYK